MKLDGECVLFYKPQGIVLEGRPELKAEDLVLIIMTPAQCEFLKKYGSDCICVDSTHGLKSYNFKLNTLLVLDDLREGFPCAFLIFNKSDKHVLSLFFSQIVLHMARGPCMAQKFNENQIKEKTVYKQLRTLLEERDSTAFEKMIERFCNMTDDPETIDL